MCILILYFSLTSLNNKVHKSRQLSASLVNDISLQQECKIADNMYFLHSFLHMPFQLHFSFHTSISTSDMAASGSILINQSEILPICCTWNSHDHNSINPPLLKWHKTQWLYQCPYTSYLKKLKSMYLVQMTVICWSFDSYSTEVL